MITAKNIYHTLAYKQMKAYCKGDKVKLKELVQQFVDNRNNHYSTFDAGMRLTRSHRISSSFTWYRTTQGQHYWNEINSVVI